MEGVVFAMRQGLDQIQDLGVPVEKIIASGGAVQHPLWLQLQADIYQRPICQTETIEAAALGAALLAAMGIGIYSDVPSACQAMVRPSSKIIEPNPNHINGYAKFFDRYARAYSLMRSIL